jgi:hypothetical protein
MMSSLDALQNSPVDETKLQKIGLGILENG